MTAKLLNKCFKDVKFKWQLDNGNVSISLMEMALYNDNIAWKRSSICVSESSPGKIFTFCRVFFIPATKIRAFKKSSTWFTFLPRRNKADTEMNYSEELLRRTLFFRRVTKRKYSSFYGDEYVFVNLHTFSDGLQM